MSWSEENPYCPRCGFLTIAPEGRYACCGYKPIKATLYHDAGAYAQCGYCHRYSADPKSLGSRPFHCDCGKTEGWSGSFKKPDENSAWSLGNKAAAVQSSTNEKGTE